MKITVAKNAGFCFGVERAARLIEDEIAKGIKGQRIFTLGKLIHNDTYNAYLAKCGVGVAEIDDIARLVAEAREDAPVKVFVRAHGIAREVSEMLIRGAEQNSSFSFVDCTDGRAHV